MRLDTGNKSKDKGRDPPDANDHRSEDHDENGQEYQERVPLPQVAVARRMGDGWMIIWTIMVTTPMMPLDSETRRFETRFRLTVRTGSFQTNPGTGAGRVGRKVS